MRVFSEGGYDAFKEGLAVGMSEDVAEKYANYVTKKTRQIKRNRLQNSYVDSGRNKVYQNLSLLLNASFQSVAKV